MEKLEMIQALNEAATLLQSVALALQEEKADTAQAPAQEEQAPAATAQEATPEAATIEEKIAWIKENVPDNPGKTFVSGFVQLLEYLGNNEAMKAYHMALPRTLRDKEIENFDVQYYAQMGVSHELLDATGSNSVTQKVAPTRELTNDNQRSYLHSAVQIINQIRGNSDGDRLLQYMQFVNPDHVMVAQQVVNIQKGLSAASKAAG